MSPPIWTSRPSAEAAALSIGDLHKFTGSKNGVARSTTTAARIDSSMRVLRFISSIAKLGSLDAGRDSGQNCVGKEPFLRRTASWGLWRLAGAEQSGWHAARDFPYSQGFERHSHGVEGKHEHVCAVEAPGNANRGGGRSRVSCRKSRACR